MTWYVWAVLVYVVASLLIGLGAALIAWDYNPWDAFVGRRCSGRSCCGAS